MSVSGHSLSGKLHSLRMSVHSLSVSVSVLLEYRRYYDPSEGYQSAELKIIPEGKGKRLADPNANGSCGYRGARTRVIDG